MLIDEARLVLHRNFAEMMALARAGEDIPLERRIRFRYDSSNAVVKCVDQFELDARIDTRDHVRGGEKR